MSFLEEGSDFRQDMDSSTDFDAQFHTPHDTTLPQKDKKMSRPATPFPPRKLRKVPQPDGELMALFNSVEARPFFTIVLFAKLILVGLTAHGLLADAAWHIQQGDEPNNPMFVLVPASALFILLALVAVGTGRALLLIPYLIIQLCFNVLAAGIIGSIAWHHHSEFLTRKEFGLALASFLLPLWISTYITFVAFRLFFCMIQQQKLRHLEKKYGASDAERGARVEEEDVIVFERPKTDSYKKRVRFS